MTQWRAAAWARVELDRPRLSVSFDDAPASAVERGAQILTEAGVRGTFYLSADFAGQKGPFGRFFAPGDVAALSRAGHEIGCHTRSHLDAAQASVGAVLLECDANAEALYRFGAPAPVSFAYPYGETSMSLKRRLSDRFSSARGIMPGVNAGWIDRMHLRACRLAPSSNGPPCGRWLRAAQRTRGWVIVFTHDVCGRPTKWGATPDCLKRLLDAAMELDLMIEPVGVVASRLWNRPAQ
jgi:peptidoglycan/xylan/chitin deacetylase (PgdA/CDA1 family)